MEIGWGLREDGTQKGPGFAAIEFPGGVASEYSLGDANFLYPSIYEDITPWDLATLARAINPPMTPAPWYKDRPLSVDRDVQDVFDRAYEGALVRLMQGKSPFWTPEDGQPGLPYTPVWW